MSFVSLQEDVQDRHDESEFAREPIGRWPLSVRVEPIPPIETPNELRAHVMPLLHELQKDVQRLLDFLSLEWNEVWQAASKRKKHVLDKAELFIRHHMPHERRRRVGDLRRQYGQTENCMKRPFGELREIARLARDSENSVRRFLLPHELLQVDEDLQICRTALRLWDRVRLDVEVFNSDWNRIEKLLSEIEQRAKSVTPPPEYEPPLGSLE